jgi:hypothetical protein
MAYDTLGAYGNLRASVRDITAERVQVRGLMNADQTQSELLPSIKGNRPSVVASPDAIDEINKSLTTLVGAFCGFL